MEFYTLASSSAGNAALVCHENTHILIDAGISCRRITQSLAALSLTLDDLDGILITHEHIDHVRALGTLQKKHAVPLYASFGTAAAISYPAPYLHVFAADETFTIKDLQIRSFRTSHDAKESVGYRIESSDGSLAVLTDTGFITDDAHDAALGADMLLLESNHDVIMLKNGSYPYYLKQRILGKCGHLSNEAAAEFAVECVRAGTSDILLAHLSDENNSPQLAEYTVGRALQASGLSVRLSAAPRDTISEVHICRRSPSFASEN